MKHIKKKTVNHLNISEEALNGVLLEFQDGKIPNFKFNEVKNKQAILIMEDGEMLRSFFYSDNGNTCTIPLANPVLIYFHTSQATLKNIYATKGDLLGLFRQHKTVNENSLKLFYDFFGMTSSFVVLLMTALEAFVNQKIPASFKFHKNEANKFTKVYDYDQIQRWISLDEKIEEILNKTTNKSFSKHFPLRQKYIDNLKDLRDGIIHTKSGTNFENYTELFKKTLNFKFTESIEAIRDFINYYEPELIEPCPCSMDF